MTESTPQSAPARSFSPLISRIVIILVVVIAAVAIIYFKDSGAGTDTDSQTGVQPAPIAKKLPVFLDLGADKCVACKAMIPVLAELKDTYGDRLDVQFIDVWKNGEAAKKHGIGLIPTQIWFDENGTELRRHEGFISTEDVLAAWRDLGYDFTAKGTN
jgi:thioredoxin 1